MDKESYNEAKKKNAEKAFLDACCFVFVIAVQLIIRIIYRADLISQINYASSSDHYYDPAYIGPDCLVYLSVASIKDLYLSILSVIFKIFGNIDSIVIVVNIAIELLAVIFAFFAIKRILGLVPGLCVGLICALYPVYFPYIMPYSLLWRENELIYLFIAFGLYLVSFIKLLLVKNDPSIKIDEQLESMSKTVQKAVEDREARQAALNDADKTDESADEVAKDTDEEIVKNQADEVVKNETEKVSKQAEEEQIKADKEKSTDNKERSDAEYLKDH